MQLADMGDGQHNTDPLPGDAPPVEGAGDERPATFADVDLPPVSEDWDQGDYAVEPRAPATPDPAATAPVVAQVPPGTTQPPGTVPAAAPGTTTPPAQAAAPATAETVRPEQVFQDIAVELGKSMPAIEQALAERDYQITDAEWETWQEKEPRQIYSLLQARVHARAVNSMMRVMAEQLPVVVSGIVRAHYANNEAVNRFYGAYPQLNRKEHGPVVANMARMVRAANPGMEEGAVSRLVAMNTMMALGIQPQAAGAPNPNGNGQRPAPVQIAQPGRQVRTVASAYTPAGVGTAPGTPPGPQRSQWDMTAALIEAEDQGRFDQ